ncbi:MAG: hypothetical protein Q8S84_06670 [bacterium]|nr:hypothetical protein [bacterium]MDP3381142.1 hypothetical protein [bacterium]
MSQFTFNHSIIQLRGISKPYSLFHILITLFPLYNISELLDNVTLSTFGLIFC